MIPGFYLQKALSLFKTKAKKMFIDRDKKPAKQGINQTGTSQIEKEFNTAGPINPGRHYYIDPLTRVNLPGILSLIDGQKYFALHAPRQTGKTSLLFALIDHLNAEGRYKCLYTNVEVAQAARENVEAGIKAILARLANDASNSLKDRFLKKNWKTIFKKNGEYVALQEVLSHWCTASKKPVVLFIDEVDSLIGDTLISLLRQLRSGYPDRPALFPHSIVLCGVRDVRDYRIHSSKEKTIITGGSAFNIKSESLRLLDFNPAQIKNLFEQHTHDTGQRFEEDVFPLVWELTEGQPWLVNALAYEACFRMPKGQERQNPVNVEIIIEAKENIIARRETHLDQLADKLAEERVVRVIEPILSGSGKVEEIPPDDLDYVTDLGLIKTAPQLTIANRIYQEIIPRQLIFTTQSTIPHDTNWYIENGRLCMDKLLRAFQEFFRENFESWIDGFKYREAGPQLLLQAFLQRIVNGGGRVEREYALGRQRTDLLIIWPALNSVQKVVLELKICYSNPEETINKGMVQTYEYMEKCGTTEGYFLLFSKQSLPWSQKIFQDERIYNGIPIKIYGM